MTMKKYIILCLTALLSMGLLYSCTEEEPQVEASEELEQETVKKEFTGELPELSVYNLPSDWTNQNGELIKLEDLKGDIVVAVMIYTTCKAACPRLIADIRRRSEEHTSELQSRPHLVCRL